MTKKNIFAKRNTEKPATGRDVQSQLDALMGVQTGKPQRPKWLKWALLGGAALLCAAAVLLIWRAKSRDAAGEVTYREYSVERGDITVGSTESSSISLARETISFPVSATVEEVYVKAGSYVDEGAPVMKLEQAQIEIGLASYALELEQAGLDLEQAKLKQKKGLLEAEQTYETTKQTGDLAEVNESVSIAELQLSLASAQQSLEKAMLDYDDYIREYYNDYCELTSLSSAASSAKKSKTSAATAASSYIATVQSTYGSAYDSADDLSGLVEEYEAAVQTLTALIDAGGDADTLTDAATGMTRAQLNAALPALNTAKTELASLEAALSTATASYDSAKTAYDNAADAYEKTYGTLGYETDYSTNIATLQTAIDKAGLALTKAELSLTTGATSADQKAETAQTNSDVAKTQLELTEMELQQAVDKAQEAYDALETEIAEIKTNISEDGTIYAPCSGMVSAVVLDAGDSFEVRYDSDTEAVIAQTLMTLTNIADVYVPITISEEDILDVSIGQEASVTMTAFSGQTFEAEVDTISVESSRSGAATVSYTVNVRFKGVNTQQVLEGMSADVTLVQWREMDVLYVSTQCVSNVGGKATVLVKGADGEPVETEVKTGFSDGRYVEILSGLSEGDVLLVESQVR